MCIHNGGLGNCDDCERSLTVLAGTPGVNGINGLNVRNGVGVPSASLGVDGEAYIDKNAPFNLYFKTAGAWVLAGQLQGIDGNGFYIKVTVDLSSPQILASGVTPVQIAPNFPGTFCVSLNEALIFAGSGTGYVASQFALGYAGLFFPVATFDPAALTAPGVIYKAIPIATQVIYGAGIVFKHIGANPTVGTLAAKVGIVYHVWPI